MTFKEYMEQALRTDSKDYFGQSMTLGSRRYTRVNHALIGMMTELGELATEFKKHVYYESPELDFRIKSKVELGDFMWYVAIFCHELNLDMDEVLKGNIQKLQNRYPHKFSTQQAMERYLTKIDGGKATEIKKEEKE